MRAQEFITELFNKSAEYDLKKTDYGYSADFMIGDIPYRFDAATVQPKTDKGREQAEISNTPAYVLQFAMQSGEDHITGTGNELQVFSTVLKMISELVEKVHPPELIFNANEASRQKLYDRLAKSIGLKLGYSHEMHNLGGGPTKQYVLVRGKE